MEEREDKVTGHHVKAENFPPALLFSFLLSLSPLSPSFSPSVPPSLRPSLSCQPPGTTTRVPPPSHSLTVPRDLLFSLKNSVVSSQKNKAQCHCPRPNNSFIFLKNNALAALPRALERARGVVQGSAPSSKNPQQSKAGPGQMRTSPPLPPPPPPTPPPPQ